MNIGRLILRLTEIEREHHDAQVYFDGRDEMEYQEVTKVVVDGDGDVIIGGDATEVEGAQDA